MSRATRERRKKAGSAPDSEPTTAREPGSAKQSERPSTLARWFGPVFGIDLRSLAAGRIALGFLVLCDLIGRSMDVEAHYTDAGTFPLAALSYRFANENLWWNSVGIQWPSYWSPLLFAHDSASVLLFFAFAALVAFCLMIGWQSRLMAFLTWFCVVSIQNRNPCILHGGDQMTRTFAFWMMFLPVGARWSVDGAVATLKAYRRPAPAEIVSPATAFYVLQVCLIYWFTALLKTGREWHSEMSALYYALSIDQYGRPLGRWLLHFPGLLKIATAATLGFESIGPALALLPLPGLRILMVFLFWGFHLVLIGGFMDVGPLPFTSALLWIPLLPGLFWEKSLAIYRSLLRRGTFSWLLGPLDRAFSALLTWRNRRVTNRVARAVPLPLIRPSVMQAIAATTFFAYIVCWNLYGTDKKKMGAWMPSGLTWITYITRLDQFWGMFAPRPLVNDGWPVVEATLDDGRQIDLFRGGTPVASSWAKPDDVAGLYPNERWRKYIMNLASDAFQDQRGLYTQYLYRTWMRDHPEVGVKIRRISFYFLREITPPPGQPAAAPVKELLWSEVYQEVRG